MTARVADKAEGGAGLGAGPDLRGRRRRRTAETIRRAALDLVRRHGLEAVTVEMIAEAAGISLRTFFNYFKYKEEALLRPPMALDGAEAEAFAAGRGSLIDDFLALIATHLEDAAPDRAEIAMIMRLAEENPRLLAVRERIFASYENAFRGLLARRLGRAEDDRETRLLSAVIGAAFEVAMNRWVAGTAADSLCEELRETLNALPRLLAEAGREGANGAG
ncbi:MAG: TetR family transcriptional regulator [Alphaproteobacteria bacterium]|nr:MAG: TetR family transcriptional regulator [Alphaproteobacteria bacterium]